MSEDTLADRIDNIAGKAERTKETIINQERSMCNIDNKIFNKAVNKVNVTFTCTIPIITLSDLRENDLGKVIQFNCIIIGQTPKKLDIETGKYIQNVLIQETESKARNNNPVMIKAVLHGDDTNNIATGQTKRFIGIYSNII